MFEEEVTIGLVYNWNYRNNTLKTCGGFHRARNRNVMELSFSYVIIITHATVTCFKPVAKLNTCGRLLGCGYVAV